MTDLTVSHFLLAISQTHHIQRQRLPLLRHQRHPIHLKRQLLAFFPDF